MKKSNLKRLFALMLAVAMLFAVSGCGKKDEGSEVENTSEIIDIEDNSSAEAPSNENTSSAGSSGGTTVSGKKTTVTVGFSAEESTEFKKIIPAFHKKYPNIKVVGKQMANRLYNITPTWTSWAAAGKLPDVIIGSENFGYVMQQGWAYPLDKLLAADPNKGDALEMGFSRFTYGGKLYALPFRMQLNGLVVNMDLLNEINAKKPSYQWTVSEFVSLCKKATTKQYSGINYLIQSQPTYSMDIKLMNAMLPVGYEQFGYSLKNKNFNLTVNNAYVNSVNLIKELRSVPGLVSDEMKDEALRAQGKMDDYDKKFGKNADAYLSGKVLIGNTSSWEYYLWDEYKFKYDFYPFPTQDGNSQRIQTHVDFVFMSSAVEESRAEAAFKLLTYLSYDKEGCSLRIDSFLASKKDAGKYSLYIPASTNKDVVNKFCSQKIIPEGLKYSFKSVVNNPEKTLVADTDKIIPDFWQNVDTYRSDAQKKIDKGTDPASLVNDMQKKINTAAATTQKYLDSKVAENLEKFYKTHPNSK